jgi:hypothetical protein
MKILFLALTALGLIGAPPITAQPRTMTVCEALNSAADHQPVVIRGRIVAFHRAAWITQGTGDDPCPGWPRYLFTAPSIIPVCLYSCSGVSVPDPLRRDVFDFLERLVSAWRADPHAKHVVTIRGVFVRNPWPFDFRTREGDWLELNRYAAVAQLVVTSVPVEETR